MEIHSNSTNKWIVNGKEYTRLEDVPKEFQGLFENIEPSHTSNKWTVNGKEYSRLEDVPAEFQALLADKNNDGMPDQFEEFFNNSKNGHPVKGATKLVLKTLFNSTNLFDSNKETGTSIPANNQSINANHEQQRFKQREQSMSTLVKIAIGVLIGMIIMFLVTRFS